MRRLSGMFDRRIQNFVGNDNLNMAALFACTWSKFAAGAFFFALLRRSRAPPYLSFSVTCTEMERRTHMKYGIVLNEDQRVLVENNLRLVCFALKKIDVKGIGGWDDAYQIGTIGLMKAAARYDKHRNTAFSTFAMPCIMNELRMEWRHVNKMSNRAVLASVDAPIPGNDDGTLTLADMIADRGVEPDAHLIYCDTRRTILDTIKNSRDKDAAVLLRMTMDGCRQDEIATVLGCSQSYISRKQKKLREAIRQALLEGLV